MDTVSPESEDAIRIAQDCRRMPHSNANHRSFADQGGPRPVNSPSPLIENVTLGLCKSMDNRANGI